MSDVSLLTGLTASSELRVASRQSGTLSLPLGVGHPGNSQRRGTETCHLHSRHEGANLNN